MRQTRRLCDACRITPEGAASDKAIVSPAGVVHLLYTTEPPPQRGRTFCGKTPADAWRRP